MKSGSSSSFSHAKSLAATPKGAEAQAHRPSRNRGRPLRHLGSPGTAATAPAPAPCASCRRPARRCCQWTGPRRLQAGRECAQMQSASAVTRRTGHAACRRALLPAVLSRASARRAAAAAQRPQPAPAAASNNICEDTKARLAECVLQDKRKTPTKPQQDPATAPGSSGASSNSRPSGGPSWRNASPICARAASSSSCNF